MAFPFCASLIMYPYQCDGCQATLKLNDKHLGRRIKCPKCETVLRVPEDLALVGIVDAELVEESDSGADDFFSDLEKYYPANQGYSNSPMTGYSQPTTSTAYASAPAWDTTPQTVIKRKKKKKSNSPLASVDLGTVGFGVLMMVGAVVWFVAGLFGGIIFFYPPILFIIGLVTMVKGFFIG